MHIPPLTYLNLIGGCLNIVVAVYIFGQSIQDILIHNIPVRLVLLYLAAILLNLLAAILNLTIVYVQLGH